jgi:hypothetical protein
MGVRIVDAVRATAQGWYLDPYGVHEHRYFSGGRPTKLVRDDGAESYDPPPVDWALPDLESLVQAPERGGQPADASDMRRADDVNRKSEPFSKARARRVAVWFQFYDKMRN